MSLVLCFTSRHSWRFCRLRRFLAFSSSALCRMWRRPRSPNGLSCGGRGAAVVNKRMNRLVPCWTYQKANNCRAYQKWPTVYACCSGSGDIRVYTCTRTYTHVHVHTRQRSYFVCRRPMGSNPIFLFLKRRCSRSQAIPPNCFELITNVVYPRLGPHIYPISFFFSAIASLRLEVKGLPNKQLSIIHEHNQAGGTIPLFFCYLSGGRVRVLYS